MAVLVQYLLLLLIVCGFWAAYLWALYHGYIPFWPF